VWKHDADQRLDVHSLRIVGSAGVFFAGLFPRTPGDSEIVTIAGLPIRVLTLERLINVKEKLDRPKDRLMLAVLKATRDERSKK
jgi:hypothetical protein